MTWNLAGVFRSPRLRLAFGVAGALFLIFAFWETWTASRAQILPNWTSTAAALALVSAGLVFGAKGWLTLFEDAAPAGLASGFFASQLGKYIPGGIWQPLGQIALATSEQVTAGKATTAFTIHAITQLTAGLTLGGLIGVFGSELPLWLRIAAVSGFISLPFLTRELLERLARHLLAWRKGATPLKPIPSQQAILKAYAWSILTLICSGMAFFLLLRSLGSPDSAALTISAFSLAWATGFLLIPFPAGVGVREAVLMFVLAATTPVVIAASVVHRLLTILTEVILIISTRRWSGLK